MLCNSPCVSVVNVPIFLTSTTGVSALTFTVSSSDFTDMGNVSVAFTPVVTITCRSIRLKPLRLVEILYVPASRLRNRNCPWESVTAVRG